MEKVWRIRAHQKRQGKENRNQVGEHKTLIDLYRKMVDWSCMKSLCRQSQKLRLYDETQSLYFILIKPHPYSFQTK